MSKIRNEEQKARRAYLDKCRKDGRKPLGIEAWKAQVKEVTNKIKKAVKDIKSKAKTEKSAPAKKAPVKRAKVHKIKRGDILEFINVHPFDLLRVAHCLVLDVINGCKEYEDK